MTSYQQIYDAFLSKVTADDWANEYEEVAGELLPDKEAKEDLRQLLENALPYFKFIRTSLARGEDGFNNDLSPEEIAIISEYMKIEWLDRTICTWENVKVMYDERDWSPANLLKQFISLLEKSEKKAQKLENIYSRSITDKDGLTILIELLGFSEKNKTINYYRLFYKTSSLKYLRYEYFRKTIFECMNLISNLEDF